MVIIIAIIRPLSPLAHSKEQWIFDSGCVRQLYASTKNVIQSIILGADCCETHFAGTPLNGGLTIKYQENLSPHIGMQCNLHIVQISEKILVKLNLASCCKRKALMIMICIYQILA
jgi:hypothetical protein